MLIIDFLLIRLVLLQGAFPGGAVVGRTCSLLVSNPSCTVFLQPSSDAELHSLMMTIFSDSPHFLRKLQRELFRYICRSEPLSHDSPSISIPSGEVPAAIRFIAEMLNISGRMVNDRLAVMAPLECGKYVYQPIDNNSHPILDVEEEWYNAGRKELVQDCQIAQMGAELDRQHQSTYMCVHVDPGASGDELKGQTIKLLFQLVGNFRAESNPHTDSQRQNTNTHS